MNIKCLAIVANGSEDSELITCTDLIKRAGGEFKYCSIDDLTVTLSHGSKLTCDFLFDELNDYSDYNLIFIPGGIKGTNRMKECPKLLELIKKFHDRGNFVAGICAGPTVLSKARIMENHKYTCYDGCENNMDNLSNYVPKAHSVVSANVITGRSVNYTIEFTLDIIKTMLGEETLNTLKKQILMD